MHFEIVAVILLYCTDSTFESLNTASSPASLTPPPLGRRRRRRVDRGDRLARQPGWSRPPAPPGRRGRPRRPSSPGRGPNDGGAPLRKPDIPSAGGTRCLAHHTRGRSCSPLGPDGGPRPAVVSPSAVMCPSAARRGCRPPSGTSRRVRGWTTAGGGTLLHWRQPSFWPGARNSNALRALALSTGTSDWSSAAVLVQPGGRRVRCRPGLLVPAPTAGLLLSYGCWSYAGAARRRQSVLSPVRSVTFLEVAVLIWSPSGGEWGGHAPVLPPGKRWRQSGSRVWWPAAHAGCCMPPLGDLLRAPHSIAAGRTCPLRHTWPLSRWPIRPYYFHVGGWQQVDGPECCLSALVGERGSVRRMGVGRSPMKRAGISFSVQAQGSLGHWAVVVGQRTYFTSAGSLLWKTWRTAPSFDWQDLQFRAVSNSIRWIRVGKWYSSASVFVHLHVIWVQHHSCQSEVDLGACRSWPGHLEIWGRWMRCLKLCTPLYHCASFLILKMRKKKY